MDSIFIVRDGLDGGIISVHYNEDDANEACRAVEREGESAYAEQWEVS